MFTVNFNMKHSLNLLNLVQITYCKITIVCNQMRVIRKLWQKMGAMKVKGVKRLIEVEREYNQFLYYRSFDEKENTCAQFIYTK